MSATPKTESGGQYFIDQATGQYYFQSHDGETMTVVQTEEDGQEGEATLEDTTVTLEEQQVEQVEEAAVQPQVGEKSKTKDNQVVLNSGGGDAYQTVTIVPSDGAGGSGSGEVSYVLIVQQPEDGDGAVSVQPKKEKGVRLATEGGNEVEMEGGMAVYDFDGDDVTEFPDDMDIEDKAKLAKMVPKRSQTVTQAHMCNYCNYTSPKRYLLSRHMKSHSEERPHKCSVCERGFKTLASLQNHVNTHTGTKPHRCKFCDSAFTTSGELVRHVRYRHTHEKPHRCTECDYQSVELSKLKRHMRCHTGERPYQCPHCTYASPDTFKLKRHLRIHTGEKPYECDICHARFTQSNSLKAHRLIHTGDKPVFQCDLCPTTCGRKTDLRLHIQKLHTSEKPMHCKMCGKSFPDRYTLKVHKKTHEGEKCFKCDLCPYSSISQRHLESHMLIHTDQKPFQCDQCDQSFRQKQLLKRHQNLYHNPNYVPPQPKEKTHECPECSRSFRHKGNLIRHMALHDPDSTAQEKAIALKIGRQKKIQIIDGQQVEVYTGDGDLDGEELLYDEGDFEEMDDEDLVAGTPHEAAANAAVEAYKAQQQASGSGVDRKPVLASTSSNSDMMAVEGQDGQHYVVLEVIQYPDGTEGTVATPATAADKGAVLASVAPAGTALATVEEEGPAEAVLGSLSQAPPPKAQLIAAKIEVEESSKEQAKKDKVSCFGFDEDDEEEEVE